MAYDDDGDEFEAHVAAVVAGNARLARLLPSGARLDEGRYSRALPPASAPRRASVLDEILADLAAQAACSAAASVESPARSRMAPPPPPLPPPPRVDDHPRPPPERLEHRDGRCCSVCLCAVARTQYSLLVPCWHVFCFACITKWLRLGTLSCPECRGQPAALLFSVRSSTDYRYRLLSEAAPALLGALEPVAKSAAPPAGS